MWINKLKYRLGLLIAPLLLSCAGMSHTPRADWYVGEFVAEAGPRNFSGSKFTCKQGACSHSMDNKPSRFDALNSYTGTKEVATSLHKLRAHVKLNPLKLYTTDLDGARKILVESQDTISQCVHINDLWMVMCTMSKDINAETEAVVAFGAYNGYDCGTKDDPDKCNYFTFLPLRRIK